MALSTSTRSTTTSDRAQIEELTQGYDDKAEYFVDRLARGIATHRRGRSIRDPVIVRMSDFKTNEYADLIGGARLRAARGEPDARLARRLRYYSRRLPRRLRAGVPGDHAGARRDRPRQHHRDDPVLPHAGGGRPGARRSWPSTAWSAARTACEVYVMCEIPSNVILADAVRRALRRLLDRPQRPDPAGARRRPRLRRGWRDLFDERNEAVKR